MGLSKNKIMASSKNLSSFKNINFKSNGLLSLEEEEKKYKPNKHKQHLLILETAQSKERNRLEHLGFSHKVSTHNRNSYVKTK